VTPTLAFRTQGVETHLRYQPLPRLSLQGGYVYLAAITVRSSAIPTLNPTLPGISIGALTALPGARPFHRPPHTGFLAAEYTGRSLTAGIKSTLSSRSDDSTYLYQNPTLLLPNRDLSPGWLSLDANVTYALTHRITAFTQLTNITDNRHIAPIGFTSTPFLIRSGLRIRIGGE
jgi:vitamin B12 transporter